MAELAAEAMAAAADLAAPPATIDFFALFGLPCRYPMDRPQLDRHYDALQRQLHPDNYVAASAAERDLALRRSSQVNEAYQTLRSPLARARHLLVCRGVASDDELQEGTVDDSAFLMANLELREQIAALAERGDGPGLRQLAHSQTAAFEALAEDFGRADVEGRGAAALELFRRMQFVAKLRDDAEQRAA